MRLSTTVIVVIVILATLTGCGPQSVSHSAPAAIGDTCLVGTWTLGQQVNATGYTLNNDTVSVSGLSGAHVTFSSDGKETEDFGGSEPLVGEYAGRQLSIVIGGSFTFSIHASKGHYAENGASITLPTTATLGGTPINYQSSYAPGSGTYQCSKNRLTMVTVDQVQTDEWSRN